jgi:hypothetical protein
MGAAEEQQLRNYMKILGLNKGFSLTSSNPERLRRKPDRRLRRFEQDEVTPSGG